MNFFVYFMHYFILSFSLKRAAPAGTFCREPNASSCARQLSGNAAGAWNTRPAGISLRRAPFARPRTANGLHQKSLMLSIPAFPLSVASFSVFFSPIPRVNHLYDDSTTKQQARASRTHPRRHTLLHSMRNCYSL